MELLGRAKYSGSRFVDYLQVGRARLRVSPTCPEGPDSDTSSFMSSSASRPYLLGDSCSSFVVLTCFLLIGSIIYYPKKKDYIGVSISIMAVGAQVLKKKVSGPSVLPPPRASMK